MWIPEPSRRIPFVFCARHSLHHGFTSVFQRIPSTCAAPWMSADFRKNGCGWRWKKSSEAGDGQRCRFLRPDPGSPLRPDPGAQKQAPPCPGAGREIIAVVKTVTERVTVSILIAVCLGNCTLRKKITMSAEHHQIFFVSPLYKIEFT